jgi:hypothetical protein
VLSRSCFPKEEKEARRKKCVSTKKIERKLKKEGKKKTGGSKGMK